MTLARTLALAALSAPLLWPLASPAQSSGEQGGGFMLEEAPAEEAPAPVYSSEVEVGVGYTNIDSFKFGEYNGLEDDGAFVIGNFYILQRDPWDSGDVGWWELSGSDVGLDSRSVHAEYGQQGNFSLFLDYDQIPHNRFNDGRTPFLGVGGNVLTLPAGWDGAPATGRTEDMSRLIPDSRPVEIETERQRIAGGIKKHFGKRWTAQASFHHEHKDGLDAQAFAFGTNGGNPAAMVLPVPIDYDTNRANVMLEYAGERGQVQLGYELSLFSNGNDSLTFQNPFARRPSGGAWDPATRFPNGFGQAALPPDNQAHQVTLSAGYNLWQTTRVMGNFSWTRMTQDERFLPYSILGACPDAGATTLESCTPLPRNSLDGQIDNILLNLSVASRPIRRMEVRASYRFEDRNNDTPQDVYLYIPGDGEDQAADFTADTARLNLPYSFTEHVGKVDVGYRVLPRVKASVGYEYDQKHRDLQEVAITREHTVHGKIRVNPLDTVSGWVEYAHGIRRGSNYVDNRPFLLNHTPEHLAASGDTFENDPRLRKFWLADRDRDSGRAVVTLMPSSRFALTLDGSLTHDDFGSTALGLQARNQISTTVDASYAPTEAVTGHAFFTYEKLRYEQRGCSFDPFPPPPATECIDAPPAPESQWKAETQDDVYTAGVGLDWHVIKNRLDFGMDYTFSKAFTEIDVTGGTNIAFAQFPDIVSRRHSLGFHLDYRLREQLTARFGYRYEMLSTKDWSVDDVGLDTISEVISLGEGSPDYNGHVFGLSLKYEF